ncbi:MAG: biopolymer transporter ExbD [Desulfobacteraceae bacterium]|nr:biopolymer transporter ExbD [Desulfobacteraceae bacterium]
MIDLGSHTTPPAKPDITPLLDVVFILLIFFVVTSVFAVQGMELDLPEAQSARSVSGNSHEIRIDKGNTLFFDKAKISSRELAFTLRGLAERSGGSPREKIILESSPDARVGLFISVVDTVRTAGFDDLVIATQPPSPPKQP